MKFELKTLSADAVPRPEVAETLPKIIHDDPDGRRPRVSDRRALRPECGIAEKSDSVHGHDA